METVFFFWHRLFGMACLQIEDVLYVSSGRREVRTALNVAREKDVELQLDPGIEVEDMVSKGIPQTVQAVLTLLALEC